MQGGREQVSLQCTYEGIFRYFDPHLWEKTDPIFMKNALHICSFGQGGLRRILEVVRIRIADLDSGF